MPGETPPLPPHHKLRAVSFPGKGPVTKDRASPQPSESEEVLDLSGESTSPTSVWGRRSCSKTLTFLTAQLLLALIIWLLLPKTFLACFRLSPPSGD